MRALRKPINLEAWSDMRRDAFNPVGGSAQIWHDTDLIIHVVSGPDMRLDYHDNPYEKLFYQIKGEVRLRTIQDGVRDEIPVREGDIYLLPPHVPHAPHRPDPNSLGFVIQRRLLLRAIHGFEWYCQGCNSRLRRVEMQRSQLARGIPPVFGEFSLAARTCRRCGHVHPA